MLSEVAASTTLKVSKYARHEFEYESHEWCPFTARVRLSTLFLRFSDYSALSTLQKGYCVSAGKSKRGSPNSVGFRFRNFSVRICFLQNGGCLALPLGLSTGVTAPHNSRRSIGENSPLDIVDFRCVIIHRHVILSFLVPFDLRSHAHRHEDVAVLDVVVAAFGAHLAC